MKIVALMAFFDEQPTWLAATVASTARFCDHIVAVDGAYNLYPQGRTSSGAHSHYAITDAAEASGIGLTLHVPDSKWMGNEVEKRTFMFQAGSLVAGPDDWFFVIDADEVVIAHPPAIRADLEVAPVLVAEVSFRDKRDISRLPHSAQAIMPTNPTSRIRRFFRRLDNMRVETNHYTYVGDLNGQKTYLWNKSDEPTLDLSGVVIEHRNHLRLQDRSQAAKTYYTFRDKVGAERATVFMEGIDGSITEVTNTGTD